MVYRESRCSQHRDTHVSFARAALVRRPPQEHLHCRTESDHESKEAENVDCGPSLRGRLRSVTILEVSVSGDGETLFSCTKSACSVSNTLGSTHDSSSQVEHSSGSICGNHPNPWRYIDEIRWYAQDGVDDAEPADAGSEAERSH